MKRAKPMAKPIKMAAVPAAPKAVLPAPKPGMSRIGNLGKYAHKQKKK